MSTPLTHAVQQVEEFVARDGWDQTPRMFALAWASELVSTEPDLAEELGISPTDAGFVPIEQDWTDEEQPLDALLAAIGWPEEVQGCVITLERIVLPDSAEAELVASGLDATSRAFADEALEHPDHQDVRMSIGVLRGGDRFCRLRVRQSDGTETFTEGPELVPGLTSALATTFEA